MRALLLILIIIYALIISYAMGCSIPFRQVDDLPSDHEPVYVYTSPEFSDDWGEYVDHAIGFWNREVGCRLMESTDSRETADVVVRFGACPGIDGIMCVGEGSVVIGRDEFLGVDVQTTEFRVFNPATFSYDYFVDTNIAPFPHVRVIKHGLGRTLDLEPVGHLSIMNPYIERQRSVVSRGHAEDLRGRFCRP